MKNALCVGINDYPGTDNDLNGCVNDMNDWAALLQERGFSVTTLADSQATTASIVSGLESLISGASAGDSIVFTFSGHGTYLPDAGTMDEANFVDEAICAYDGNIIDDQIRGILSGLASDVKLTIICDSCHSGSVTRQRITNSAGTSLLLADEYPIRERFMPPADHTRITRLMVPLRRRAFSDAGMNHVLLTGCRADEVSYDAWLNGRYNGAMTAHAIALIRDMPTSATYRQLNNRIRSYLPNASFDQTPQIEGPEGMRDLAIFS